MDWSLRPVHFINLHLCQQFFLLRLEFFIGHDTLFTQLIQFSDLRWDAYRVLRVSSRPFVAEFLLGIQHRGLELDRVADALEEVDSRLAGGHDLNITIIEQPAKKGLGHLDIVDLFER